MYDLYGVLVMTKMDILAKADLFEMSLHLNF